MSPSPAAGSREDVPCSESGPLSSLLRDLSASPPFLKRTLAIVDHLVGLGEGFFTCITPIDFHSPAFRDRIHISRWSHWISEMLSDSLNVIYLVSAKPRINKKNRANEVFKISNTK